MVEPLREAGWGKTTWTTNKTITVFSYKDNILGIAQKQYEPQKSRKGGGVEYPDLSGRTITKNVFGPVPEPDAAAEP